MSKIKWDSEEYEIAITQWIVKRLKTLKIKETHFSRNAGLGKNETDARTFRKIKEGKRRWSIVDLCKISSFFNENPSSLLSRVEKFYKTEGILIPGKTAVNIFGMGLLQNKESLTLISTWEKKGKNFILKDCDPDWKKSTNGKFAAIIGLTSKEIFPGHPEVTKAFESAWEKRAEERATICYEVKTSLEKKIFQSNEAKRTLLFNVLFVPADTVVVYAKDITNEKELK